MILCCGMVMRPLSQKTTHSNFRSTENDFGSGLDTFQARPLLVNTIVHQFPIEVWLVTLRILRDAMFGGALIGHPRSF